MTISIFCLWNYTTVLQDITTGETGKKDTKDLLTHACKCNFCKIKISIKKINRNTVLELLTNTLRTDKAIRFLRRGTKTISICRCYTWKNLKEKYKINTSD